MVVRTGAFCWLTAIFLFLLHAEIQAQQHTQTIRGRVVDKTTLMPLPGASVVIPGTEPLRGTVCDKDGYFRLENVAIGRISIKISFLGYEDYYLGHLELTSGKELFIQAELTEKVFTGSEVVISANADKTQTINRMITVSGREFSIEESELYAGARSDISRMAANFAGVSGGDDSRNDIIIRGNTPSGLLWRLDGVDIPNPNHFAAFGTTGGPISILRNSLLSNSDFITAAFPAGYGNALAGVFDLKLINGNSEKHEFMGQIAFNGIELGAEGPLHRESSSSYIINYRYSTLDVFSRMGIELGTGQGVPKYQDLLFKIHLPRTAAGSFSLFGFGGISSIAFLDSKKDTTVDKIDFYGSEGWDITNHSNQGMAGISHMIHTGRDAYFKSVLAATYHQFTTYRDSVNPSTLATFPWQQSDLRECRLTAGTMYAKKFSARSNMNSGISLILFQHGIIDSLYSFSLNRYQRKNKHSGYSFLIQPYVQWQYRFSEKLSLNSGMHFMIHQASESYTAEPRLGLRYKVAPLHTLSIGGGLHSQTVPVTVFFRQTETADGSEMLTNTGLKLMRSAHAVVSWDWIPAENLRMKTEVYYQYLFNIPVDITESSSYSLLNEGANFEIQSPDSLGSEGKGRNYGVELTLEKFLSKGYYYLLTASVFDSEYAGSDAQWRNTAFNGSYTLNVLAGKEFNFRLRKNKVEKRRKTFVINIKSTLGGGQRYTEVDAMASLAAQRPVYIDSRAWESRFPDYSRTDLKLGYKMNGRKFTIEWSLEITNIFNQKNVFNQTFNRKTGETYFTYQLGRMIIPQYRIIF